VSQLNLILGASNCLSAMLFMLLAIPLMLGRIKRNVWYGVRFRQSFASDEAWQAINRYGARRLFVWSIPLVAIGVVAFFLPLDGHPLLVMAVGLAPLVVLAPAWESWRFARHYGDAHSASSG
jgi:hypothetical protein